VIDYIEYYSEKNVANYLNAYSILPSRQAKGAHTLKVRLSMHSGVALKYPSLWD